VYPPELFHGCWNRCVIVFHETATEYYFNQANSIKRI
jgi:hypothetical protein